MWFMTQKIASFLPVIFVALYCLLFAGKAFGIDNNCKPCLCCVNGSCLKETDETVILCNHGCIDGYYGRRCWDKCPANCTVCTGRKACSVCEDGYFIKSYQVVESGEDKTNKLCSSLCRNTCKSCLTYDNCIECIPGFYGLNCSTSCSDSCFNSTCNKSNGTCDACKYGFTGDQCDTCTCIDGVFGTNCTEICPFGCFSGKCDKANGMCDTCKSDFRGQMCNQCIDGFFGTNCSNACPFRCRTCDKTSGACNESECKSGFTGYNCSSCAGDFYGTYCNESCPENCASCNSSSDCQTQCLKECNANICFHDNGTCTNGCVQGKYGSKCDANCPVNCTSCISPTECTACTPGTYGLYCQLSCSDGCSNYSCDKTDGVCLNGCKQDFISDTCNICALGHYGTDCHKSCSENCTCGRSSGKCIECIHGQYGEHCNKSCPQGCANGICKNDTGHCFDCIIGKYGNYCDVKCSSKCIDSECYSDGACVNGCIYGFYGMYCNMSCPDLCSVCKSSYEGYTCNNRINCGFSNKSSHSSVCDKCKDRYYPENGTSGCVLCKDSCYSRKCDSRTGVCLRCNKGYWGDMCEKECPQNCLRCDQYTGVCEICETGKYNKNCLLNCSEHCKIVNGDTLICHMVKGTCVHGCKNDLTFGQACNISCSAHCKNGRCDWKTGRCIEGCIPNMYGHTCGNICSDKCQSEHMKSSSCHVQNGTCVFECVPGYYGDRCERNCSKNCLNKTCEQSTAICVYGCDGAFSEQTCNNELHDVNANDNGSATEVVVIVVVVVVLALITVLVTALILLKKRRNRTQLSCNTYENSVFYRNITRDDIGTAIELTHRNVKDTLYTGTSVSINDNYEKLTSTVRESTYSTMSTEVLDSHDLATGGERISSNRTYRNVRGRIDVDKLQEYVAEKQKVDFEIEFLNFPKGLVDGKSYAESQKKANKSKNRFRSIFPYDDHRVKLTGPGTDYINASFVDGFDKRNAYIACQGPTENTTEYFVTFWRMVWQQKVEKIVMLTNLYENGNHKCDKYWPDAEINGIYGAITVTCQSEDVFSEYTVRRFTVSQKSENRCLHHIHFSSWPDKGVPDDVTSIIEFRQKVNSLPTALNGPIIVHCSAGIGRTGTYIGLDILTNVGEAQHSVDIFGCVQHMREHRLNMVQTAEQYEYLHNVLVHSLTFDCQSIHADTFKQYVDTLSDTEIGKMYGLLNVTTESDSETEVEARARNRTMTVANRHGADIPGDCHRRKLYVHTKHLTTGYINAVYVDSFKRKNRYIVTQTPLPETVVDFLHLVWQTKCCCIVSLEPQEVFNTKAVASYFRTDNQVLEFGTFRVTCVDDGSTPYCVIHKLTIEHDEHEARSEKRMVYHFQYTQWNGNQAVPCTPESMLGIITDVENRSNNTANDVPIILHCLNAGEKSGLFCAVSVLMQKLETDHEASVANTVRKIRSRRKNAILNKEQYWFCYRCVSAYLTSFNTHSNFSMTS